MAGFSKIIPLLFLLLICKTTISAESLSKEEELVESESKDGNLEIIKQIKKVNEDGSYTIGYEADDGTFKIESRDVLGNIKGTYGYIDEEGQIKRVSYSTSNSSEILTKPEAPSVVQRIPKSNRTTTQPTTKRPTPVYSTTQSTPTSTTALQRLAKLRSLSTSTTTDRPNYSEVVSMESEISKTTSKPHIVYPSSTPRILLHSRPLMRSTQATHTQKSEGQILRPEVVTIKPTELPLFRRLALRHQILNDEKPSAEEPEVRSNILRRQLTQEKNHFDPQQHVFTLQQSLGNDVTDVYSSSVTTGTPRPLFTTTARPRAHLLSTTTNPTVVSRPTVRYPPNYQRNDLQNLEANTPEYVQDPTTTESTVNEATPTPVPVVQIPANRGTQEPLIAIRHPFHGGTILVPLSQLQGRILDVNENQAQYVPQPETTPKPTPEAAPPQPIYVRRLPPPQFRPIPVQVDENGYLRDIQRQTHVLPASYPLPVPVTPVPRYLDNSIENDIDDISPPVSTRDFQKLLQQLIIRQSRLERISALTDPRRHPEYYQPRYRPVYQQNPAPYYVQRVSEGQLRGPVQFVPEDSQEGRQRQVVHITPPPASVRQQRQEQDPYNERGQSYVPTRRVARLLQPGQQQDAKEEFLPADVREMLLLRMLQLAINPALPVNEGEMVEETTSVPEYKKVPVRNVEILGEESEEEKIPMRTKRYRDSRMVYY